MKTEKGIPASAGQPSEASESKTTQKKIKNPLVDVATRPGDSLATIFNRVGLNAKVLHEVLDKNKYAHLLTKIKPGQTFHFVIKHHALKQLSVELEHGQSLIVVRDRHAYKTTLYTPKMEYRERYLTAIVQYSLYSTAKRQNIPYKLIQQMTDIFKREINFAKDVRSGDRFTIIYKAGYMDGNVIKISHHNSVYTSVYAHLLKFKKGLFRGSYVKRGDLIGYVGKSGLVSGPHCHYEFHVNHHPRNPSTVSLPQAAPVPRRDLASFKRQADKLIEHLKLFEEAHLVSKNDKAVG